jgi:HAD superfamily hydrolase (TIGR01509 family)
MLGMRPRFVAVLFDMDGVLADTEQLKGMAHVAAVSSFGYAAGVAEYRTVLGTSSDHVMRHFLDSAGASHVDPSIYRERYRSAYNRLLRDGLRPMPGAIRLMRSVRASKSYIAVVSSSDRSTIDLILSRLKIIDMVDTIVSSDDVSKGKPDPESYLMAASRLHVRGCDCVAIEDTESGVMSAIAAGCTVIAVRHELNRSQDFARAELEVGSLVEHERIDELLSSVIKD